MQDDFIKEPRKAALHYREESLRAMAAGQKQAARYWRLAADAAKQVVRQRRKNNILASVEMPFIDNFIRLGFSLQKTNEALTYHSDKKNQHAILKGSFPEEIFSHYRYWMSCLVVSCSYHFEKEMRQLIDVAKKYREITPEVSLYAEQAYHFFKTAQQRQQSKVAESSVEGELIIAFWAIAAYESAHVANIFVQRKAIEQQSNHDLLEYWETMTHDAKEVLSLRIKAAEASEEAREEQAFEYSLAACAMNSASDSLVQMIKGLVSDKQSLAKQWREVVPRALKISEMRRMLATLKSPQALQNVAVSWFEAALEADLKRVEAIAREYNEVACYWEQSRDFSEQVAALYEKSILTTQISFPFMQRWNKMMLRRLEKKAQKKIPIMFMEEIFFCMPQNYFPSHRFRKQWEGGEFVNFLDFNSSLTVNTWLYQTGTLLQRAGVSCRFFTKMPHLPDRGILITMSGFLYGYSKCSSWPPSLFLVDIAADDGIPRAVAMLHLIPNSHITKYLPFSKFIPHWSQPFLIPRSVERGDRFETICFMGDPQNMTPELCSQEWHLRLKQELGLRFICRDYDQWHDFSDVDCILAIRDFSGKRFCYKPAHKLHNAWLAGVPFIGGRDSAFVGDGHPGVDYLVADSVEEVFFHLKRLKEDPVFRLQLVEQGHQSGVAFTREAILESWKRLVLETLPVSAQKWYSSSAVKRSLVKLLQRWSCAIQSFIHKYYKPIKYTFVSGKKPDLFAWASPSPDISYFSACGLAKADEELRSR